VGLSPAFTDEMISLIALHTTELAGRVLAPSNINHNKWFYPSNSST